MRCSTIAFAGLAFAVAPALANRAEYDAAMLALATRSGCMACHTVQPAPPRADGLPPIAPAWRDVAVRYRDDPRASERLTKVVLAGKVPNRRHGAQMKSPVAMPPNATAIAADDARRLVNWILVLVP